jgi:hypothetical protein
MHRSQTLVVTIWPGGPLAPSKLAFKQESIARGTVIIVLGVHPPVLTEFDNAVS